MFQFPAFPVARTSSPCYERSEDYINQLKTMISKKVILTGSFGVGKTSLFNRFIYQQFSDKYLTTIGVKVNNKIVEIGDEKVSMMIWDIAGNLRIDRVALRAELIAREPQSGERIEHGARFLSVLGRRRRGSRATGLYVDHQ